MQCAICFRGPPSSRLPFRCVSCARNALYELRIDQASSLLEKESLSQTIDQVAPSVMTDDDLLQRISSSQATFADVESVQARMTEIEIRTRDIITHTEMLRREIEDGKADILRRKAALAQRRSEHTCLVLQLDVKRKGALEKVQKEIKRTTRKAGEQHQHIVVGRAFLCREAASLYDLKQRKFRMQGVVKEDYTIGGISIADLRDLNNAPPAQITASLTRLCSLIVHTSHYLSVQLPAEITLPHRDYPLPTIFPPSASYTLHSTSVLFPGLTPSHSTSNTPTTPRSTTSMDQALLPRPRPLYIEKALPVLLKEDPAAYSLFVEGVSLLAYNVAWLCRTQGLDVASSSWEDVCPLGKNLWTLMCNKSSESSEVVPNDATQPLAAGRPQLGYYSHGTAHAFLGQGEGADLMRSWKIKSATQVTDKVKALLQGETAGAEWEMLEEREWDGGGGLGDLQEEGDSTERESNEEVVLVQGTRRDMTDEVEDANEERKLSTVGFTGGSGGGTSGWTKLKPR